LLWVLYGFCEVEDGAEVLENGVDEAHTEAIRSGSLRPLEMHICIHWCL